MPVNRRELLNKVDEMIEEEIVEEMIEEKMIEEIIEEEMIKKEKIIIILVN